MRVCSVSGCPTLYDSSEGSRCAKHRQESKQAHWAKTTAYSSKGHRQFREAVLRRDPICVLCGLKQATVADHYPHTRAELIDLHLNPNDPQYGRGLDKQCHDRHTAATSPSGWNAR